MNFHPATPILPVEALARSVRYYVGRLGFKVDWQQPHVIASVSRGRCTLFLVEGDQGAPPTWAWIGVGDVNALHSELRKKKARIRQGPTNFVWAREIQVEDPDGNVLRFGSDPKDGPRGPWLDMRGARWVMGADGRWTRLAVARRKHARRAKRP
jgi:catechol 2,3-dioxygenase-like lactoylglutathione lyase family enzyme